MFLFATDFDVPVLSFKQIDWGSFGSSADTQGVNSVITVEDGIDWGISLEPSSEVRHLDTPAF